MSSLSSPSAPAPPPQLSFGQNIYLSVHLSPGAPTTSGLIRRDGPPILTDPVPVSYVAPVGALADEHIFRVPGLDQAGRRWAEVEKDVFAALNNIDGIKRELDLIVHAHGETVLQSLQDLFTFTTTSHSR